MAVLKIKTGTLPRVQLSMTRRADFTSTTDAGGFQASADRTVVGARVTAVTSDGRRIIRAGQLLRVSIAQRGFVREY